MESPEAAYAQLRIMTPAGYRRWCLPAHRPRAGCPPSGTPSPGPGRACPRREHALCLEERSVKSRRRNPRLTTCFDDLATGIRAWAKGWLPAEAAAELLISPRGWVERGEFLQGGGRVA